MWMILQQDVPEDFVLATGETTSVRDFTKWVFEHAGFKLEFRGSGEEEKGYCAKTGRCLVEIDPRYFRPTEVDLLLGDASKAKDTLGWVAETSVRDLAREMYEADLAALRQGAA